MSDAIVCLTQYTNEMTHMHTISYFESCKSDYSRQRMQLASYVHEHVAHVNNTWNFTLAL